jgi:hypothetical protein
VEIGKLKNAIRALAIAVVIIGSVASAAAGSTIHLNFTVEPAETLPFIPVAFRVRAINTGSAPAVLPIGVRLAIRTGSEDWKPVCFAHAETNGCADTFPVEEGPRIELAPGEERVLDFLPGLNSPPWFAHPDLREPGTHRLRLTTWGEFPGSEEISSNEAVLTITTPTGEDAGAWKLIAGDPTNRGVFADQLWDLYPNSVYTAITPRVVAQDKTDWKAYLDAYTEVLGKNPPTGFADAFKRGMVEAHRQLMRDAAHQFDVQKAFQHTEAARALLQELVTKETEARLKLEAAKVLEENIMTLAEIEDLIEQLRFLKPGPACERADVKHVRSALVELMRRAEDKQAETTLGEAIADLDKYEAGAAKTPPDMHAALAWLDQAASRIETALKHEWIPSTDGTNALKALARAAELSATKAIDASTKEPKVKQSDLDLAKRKSEEGRAAVEAGDFKKAISRFREAVHKAEGASSARGSFC